MIQSKTQPANVHHDCCGNDNTPSAVGHASMAHIEEGSWKAHLDLLISLAVLVIMLVLEYGLSIQFSSWVNLLIYGGAYLLAGWKVLDLAFRKLKRGDIFNEFFLMSIATVGAFLIGEFSEGVAVMVFYSIGEWFQDSAVRKAKGNIKSLLDIRPDQVSVVREGITQVIHPGKVQPGDIIRMKPGEKVALDGKLVTHSAAFNTAALTGESKPDTKYEGETVLAGMINLNSVSEVKVSTLYKDSKLSKILEMVQDATSRKSQTQLFISKFAKVYTPIVFFLAIAVCLFPYFLFPDYQFSTWFYRALVFLVISCPCALVVSIPLGYFGGIGLASRNGILFKGGNFLDALANVEAVVMDKTGTLTKGVFKVQQVVTDGFDENELLELTAGLEKNSTHPVAQAIVEYSGYHEGGAKIADIQEIAGHGMKGFVNGSEILAGNEKLMRKFGISYPEELGNIADTTVIVAVNNKYSGHIIIADELKDDAGYAIRELHKRGIKTIILSGDKQSVVDEVAQKLAIGEAYGDLLPDAKVEKVKHLKGLGYRLAFAGDGVNDAPVIALADVGIAMGGLGSDATIETADVVIQNDQPSKILTGIKVGKITRSIVWQNIILALTVKVVVLSLGAGGVANLWEAVIADVGVALLAILNAVRIQHKSL